jgi:hypothetical protein
MKMASPYTRYIKIMNMWFADTIIYRYGAEFMNA